MSVLCRHPIIFSMSYHQFQICSYKSGVIWQNCGFLLDIGVKLIYIDSAYPLCLVYCVSLINIDSKTFL